MVQIIFHRLLCMSDMKFSYQRSGDSLFFTDSSTLKPAAPNLLITPTELPPHACAVFAMVYNIPRNIMFIEAI